jgi:hypothetical protein
MQHRFLTASRTKMFAQAAVTAGTKFRRGVMGGRARRRMGRRRQRVLSADKTEC